MWTRPSPRDPRRAALNDAMEPRREAAVGGSSASRTSRTRFLASSLCTPEEIVNKDVDIELTQEIFDVQLGRKALTSRSQKWLHLTPNRTEIDFKTPVFTLCLCNSKASQFITN